jgi:UDP:flavonoid glycosyltransferase YjiC (YdhE family)
VALFPDWFAAKQPDWPTQTVLTGFPLYSEQGITPLSEELEDFLSAGAPPIAFTPGSANIFGGRFFQAAAEACRILGKRGLLLTRFAEQVPTILPENVRHFDFAPFTELLPRCEALVHHGGIGSLSQAMAAGIPQVIMPMGFDQIDNAYRVKRLNAGDLLFPSRFDGSRLASVLGNLLGDPKTALACKQLSRRISQVDSLDVACDVIEAS